MLSDVELGRLGVEGMEAGRVWAGWAGEVDSCGGDWARAIDPHPSRSRIRVKKPG
jgi:hypothetical protein